MSEYERLGIAQVTADRILEQAHLVLRELAARPDETLYRRRAAKYGHLLLASGWATDMDWIDEVQG